MFSVSLPINMWCPCLFLLQNNWQTPHLSRISSTNTYSGELPTTLIVMPAFRKIIMILLSSAAMADSSLDLNLSASNISQLYSTSSVNIY